jgi:transposase
MKRPHASDDVRERALAAVDEGHPVADVAAFFQNDPSPIYRWLRQRRRTGSGLSRPRSGRPPVLSAPDWVVLRQQVAAHPDATLTPTGFGPGYQFPGAVDRQVFDGFVERILVPSLRPGQPVVLDNLSVHKSATARRMIEAAGCQLVFLPTYSPDFNPIEQAFATLTQRLRSSAARTVAGIMDASQAAYPSITAQDARSFYQNAGYNL